MRPGHQLENHTADVALRTWGETLADIFEQAALAMTGLMYDVQAVEPREVRSVELEAPDSELLLAAWLNELLFLLEAETFLGRDFRIDELGPTDDGQSRLGVRLKATVAGERDTTGRHHVRTAVKAATLHNLSVRPRNTGWEGYVLLDV